MRKTALALFLLLSLPAAAQHIVGTAFNGGFVQLVDLNPATGAASFVGSPTDAISISGQTAYDAIGNRYFFVGTPTGFPPGTNLNIYVVSGGGTSFTKGTLSGAYNSILDIEFEVQGATLVALLDVGAGAKRLGAVTYTGAGIGTVTLMGSGPFSGGASIPFSGFAKIDALLDYYFYGSPNLYVAALWLASPDIPPGGSGPTVSFVQGLQADADTGAVYALTMNGATSDRRIQALDTTLGVTFGQATATGPDLNGGAPLSTSGAETFDSSGNVYYFLGTPNGGSLSLYAVATPALTLVAGYPKTLTGVTSVVNLEFDAGTLPVTLQRFAAD